MRIKAFAAAILIPMAAAAEEPLSVIDWLNDHPGTNLPGTVVMEPPVSDRIVSPQIDVSPLEELASPLGLVPASVTGLPLDLWIESDVDDLIDQIASVPVADSPAMQALLYSLLLSETRPPSGAAAERLALARIDRLMALGAVDPAQALTRRADPTTSSDLFRRWFDATLLTGEEEQSCRVLAARPFLAPGYDARIFCTARAGDWQTAALTLETAHALAILPQWKLNLLDRFLSPEIFEGAPPLPAPTYPDPLSYRIHEAIGERLSAHDLPRAFATADLRDVAGWKAQIEAAERLTRVGALSANQLLGLYTERLPAASGGVWDRVDALQRFETALGTRSPDALAKTLPPIWSAMRQVGLATPFAELFADPLARQTLPDPGTKNMAWQIRLLSSEYEAAAHFPPDQSKDSLFLAALAQGDPGRVKPPNDLAAAIAEGFSTQGSVPIDIQDAIDEARLGEAILMTMDLFDSGASGNPADLSSSISSFRSMGLEDTARRASLHLMILGHG